MDKSKAKKIMISILEEEKKNYPNLNYTFITNLEIFLGNKFPSYKYKLVKRNMQYTDMLFVSSEIITESILSNPNNSIAACCSSTNLLVFYLDEIISEGKRVKMPLEYFLVLTIYHELTHLSQNMLYNEKHNYSYAFDKCILNSISNPFTVKNVEDRVLLSQLYDKLYVRSYIELEAELNGCKKAYDLSLKNKEKIEYLKNYYLELLDKKFNYNFMNSLNIYIEALKVEEFNSDSFLDVFIKDKRLRNFDELDMQVFSNNYFYITYKEQVLDFITDERMLQTIPHDYNGIFLEDVLIDRLRQIDNKLAYNNDHFLNTDYYEINLKKLNVEKERLKNYYDKLYGEENNIRK